VCQEIRRNLMSQLLIQHYLNELQTLRRVSGTSRESVVREAFKALREMIEVAEKDNDKFRKASLKFLKHAQDTINPSVTAADMREMLI
jgi:hypothetical protein